MTRHKRAEPALFPVNRRASEIRSAAEMLYNSHGEAALHYWKTVTRSLADQLLALGYSEDRIRAEILSFQDSVQIEMQNFA